MHLEKKLSANHAEYMTKDLRKAIRRRSALENKFRKMALNNTTKHTRNKNIICSRVYKKERRKYYNNLDHKTIADNKQFWKAVKPFFSNKGKLVTK